MRLGLGNSGRLLTLIEFSSIVLHQRTSIGGTQSGREGGVTLQEGGGAESPPGWLEWSRGRRLLIAYCIKTLNCSHPQYQCQDWTFLVQFRVRVSSRQRQESEYLSLPKEHGLASVGAQGRQWA